MQEAIAATRLLGQGCRLAKDFITAMNNIVLFHQNIANLNAQLTLLSRLGECTRSMTSPCLPGRYVPWAVGYRVSSCSASGLCDELFDVQSLQSAVSSQCCLMQLRAKASSSTQCCVFVRCWWKTEYLVVALAKPPMFVMEQLLSSK